MRQVFSLIPAFSTPLLSFSAWAQEVHHDVMMTPTGEAAVPMEHAAAHGSGGLPQFDPTWFASQIFWLALCFGFLFLLFGKLTLPRIASTLESRRKSIEDMMLAAENLSAESRQIQEAYEAHLKKVAADAAHEVQAAEKVAKEKLAATLHEFRARFDLEVSVTETRLEKAKTVAVEEINGHVAELAAQAAQKLAGISANPSEAQSVVRNLSKKAEAA